ncbi:hypothetical protein D9M70_417840 [compost metagenome]
MVARAENTGEERQADDDIEPFLDDFAVDTVELDHQEGEHRCHDQFPDAFDPEVDDVPPVHLVECQVDRVVEGEKEEDRHAPEPEDQDVGNGRLAAFQHRQRDVVEEHQRDDDDSHLDREGLFEEFAPLMNVQEVADDGDGRGDQEDPELRNGDLRAVEFGFRLFRQQVIGRAHEAHEQPDDQRVGVDHAHDIEGQQLGERIG